ncbi:MAG: ABC transporter ATP-binding protein [Clostridiales bacterium]|nr:ABC transporter ATP-binding protein [Clostridiales bacterium]
MVSAIKMENISKSFGKVLANKNINFEARGGEIHALLGENGAGKSTLMNMLSGIYSPDSGSIYVKGNRVNFRSPRDSIQAGIGMIHQHFKLIDALSARESIILGERGGLFLNVKKNNEKIDELFEKYGLDINLDKKIYEMSVGEKQNVEIIKVLYKGADILIMDEPTAVLTPQEIDRLFEIMNNMKKHGCCIIIITHKMNEVMEIADRVTVLHKGRTISTVDKDKTTPEKLTELMVGRPMDLSVKRAVTVKGKKVLDVKNLSVLNEDNVKVINNICFDIKEGEILGVAGVAGSGQKELCESIAGLIPPDSGEILYFNENIIGRTPGEIIEKGISMSFVPEDRLGMGLVASMDIVDNMILKDYRIQKGLLIDREPAKRKAGEVVEKLNIQTPGINFPVKKLSGGNIQKVLLGREMMSNPKLLITAYPVRGLDVGAAHTIYNLLNKQKKRGVAVLYIGEDLDVLIELCDRIMVLYDGRISGIMDAKDATREKLGLLMTGGRREDSADEIN